MMTSVSPPNKLSRPLFSSSKSSTEVASSCVFLCCFECGIEGLRHTIRSRSQVQSSRRGSSDAVQNRCGRCEGGSRGSNSDDREC
mmetsp:Transcript_12075/g.13548  ORF Transcript_12075/g.13548 Transcript_12075/m.13548 type:complete len:85 (+) Transcript_12075:605-859(+)